MQRRTMPPDFPDYVDETYAALKQRYHARQDAIRRWKLELGFNEIRGGAKKPVLQYNMDGVLVGRYQSIQDAAAQVYGERNLISKCAHGKFKQAYGYIWRFEDAEIQGSL